MSIASLGRREASRPAGGGRVEKEEPPTFSTAAALPFLCVSPPFKNWRKIFAMKIVSSIPPEPPAHLSASARRWWQTTVETYELEEHHLRLLQLVCEAWDRSQMARELLDREGLTVPGREGGTRPHPAVAIERDARLAVARLVRELDLDVGPPAPSRIGPPPLLSNRGRRHAG